MMLYRDRDIPGLNGQLLAVDGQWMAIVHC